MSPVASTPLLFDERLLIFRKLPWSSPVLPTSLHRHRARTTMAGTSALLLYRVSERTRQYACITGVACCLLD